MFSKLRAKLFTRAWWPWSLRARLTLLMSLVLAVALVLFAVLTYDRFLISQQEDFDIALYNHSVDVADAIDSNELGRRLIDSSGVSDVKIFPFALSRTYMQIRSTRDGRILAKDGPVETFDLPYDPTDQHLLNAGRDSTFRTLEAADISEDEKEHDTFRLINFPLDEAKEPTLVLQIAVPLTLLESQIASLKGFFQFSLPLILLFAGLAGYFLARRTLGPVQTVIEKAQNIGPGRLHDRLPQPRSMDEIGRMTATFNQLLDRLEKAFNSQEQFIANASHQLLTPLAIIRGELESAVEHAGTEAPKLVSATQEVERLAKLARDLLTLAKVEAGADALYKRSVSFDDLVMEELAAARPLADRKKIQMRLNVQGLSENPEAFEIEADPDLMRVLIANLVENAIKYSKEGSLVEIGVLGADHTLELDVSDEGPGIPPEDLPFIFDRFYRGSNIKTVASGTGLGLAIAQRISLAHGAELTAENRSPQGATFRFRIRKN